MNSSKLSSVPLQFASLCLDCEFITCANGRCLSCGSSALLSLARMLNGETRMPLREPRAETVPPPNPSVAARSVNFFQST
jgi:hypothetical protein